MTALPPPSESALRRALTRAERGVTLDATEAETLLHARGLGCKEALFTLGDRPETRWPVAGEWLHAHGFDSTLGYLRAMAIRVLEETGLLPHLNPGVLTWEEFQRLKPVAASMGMMLETTATRLWSAPGGPHFGSPDKEPAVRLRVLEDAGRSAVPFTTGVLLGIGESYAERVGALLQIRAAAQRHGHVQEVIVQNFRAKPRTAMAAHDDLELQEYVAAVAVTRLLLGTKARVQAPPKLSDSTELGLLLRAGIDDWGGVSPLTPDHVNPERPWPHTDKLAALSAEAGYTLRERLAAQPPYVLAPEPWLDPRVRPHLSPPAGGDGLAVEGRIPAGLPWQEPDESWTSSGRTDLHVEVDTVGRTGDRRSDFDDVYGDWAELREQTVSARDGHSTALTAGDPDVLAALLHAEADPAGL